MSDQRILAGRAATLTVTLLDQNGKAADAAGTVTVGITKADGTVVKAADTATTNPTGAGTYAVALTATQVGTAPDELTATWTDSGGGSQTTTVAIVGGYYTTIDELRLLPNLSDTTKFPDTKLVAARTWFEDRFEQYTGRAMVPRYRRLTLVGTGRAELVVPDTDLRTVRAATVDSTVLAASVLTALHFTGGVIRQNILTSSINSTSYEAPFGWPGSTITIGYEYGLDSPPDDVREAAKIAIRSRLLNDQTGTPMLSVADGAGGTTRFLLADDNRPFGVPEVDTVANAYRRGDTSMASVPIGTR